MGRQSQNCLEQSHHHEVYGSYWVIPCLRIVGPLRCRIWSTRCTSYCFPPSSSSFTAPFAQYSRPCSSPPRSVASCWPSHPASPYPIPPSGPCTFSTFCPPTSITFSPCSHTSGWSCFGTCPFQPGSRPCTAAFGCRPCPFAICPCTSSSSCNSLKPVPCSG